MNDYRVFTRTLGWWRTGTRHFALIAAVTACSAGVNVSEGTAMMRIETSATAFSPGDSVHVTVENIGLTAVRFFACPLIVDRADGNEWTEVGPVRGFGPSDCDLVTTPLRPQETTRVSARLDPSLPAGTYRLRFEQIHVDLATQLALQSRVTNAFSVR